MLFDVALFVLPTLVLMRTLIAVVLVYNILVAHGGSLREPWSVPDCVIG